jgi:hypothetical protein
MRFRLTVDDVLLFAVVVALLYFRNWWAALVFVVVLAYLIYHYIQAKKKDSPADTNEFLIDRDDMSHASAELDVDIRYRPAPNHFRIDENFDTRYTDSEYEFRIDRTGAGGTKVFARLIALKTMDIMEKEHYQVRDGVVLETDMRQMDEGHTLVLKDLTEWRLPAYGALAPVIFPNRRDRRCKLCNSEQTSRRASYM